MAGFGWSHPRHAAEAGPAPPPVTPRAGPGRSSPLPRPIAAFGPLRTVRRFHPGAPRREGFSEILQKNGHLAYTGLATWQRARPPPPDNLQPEEESNPQKPWKSLPRYKGERDRNGHKEADV